MIIACTSTYEDFNNNNVKRSSIIKLAKMFSKKVNKVYKIGNVHYYFECNSRKFIMYGKVQCHFDIDRNLKCKT